MLGFLSCVSLLYIGTYRPFVQVGVFNCLYQLIDSKRVLMGKKWSVSLVYTSAYVAFIKVGFIEVS